MVMLVSSLMMLSASAAPVASEGAAPVAVAAAVDLTAPTTTFPHFWKRCVGSGHMALGARDDWRRHLKLAHDELGFAGVRGHGLLDDDMSVMPGRGASGTGDGARYEWYNVDQVYDYLVEIGVRPVVELSFMPKALVTCSFAGKPDRDRDTSSNASAVGCCPRANCVPPCVCCPEPTPVPECSYVHGNAGGYKGLQMPPDDFNDWYLLVKALATHLVSRYGLTEVQKWHFEVWNEMQGLRPRPVEDKGVPPLYLELFNASSLALKSVDKSLQVGGPATMQLFDVADFLAKTKAQNIALDFVSTHLYPTCPECQANSTAARPDCT